MVRRKPLTGQLVVKEQSITPMLTRKRRSQQQTDAVFGNPLLMDKIIKYSVHKSNGKELDKPTVISVRLVNLNWLRSASRTLKISGDYTIEIVIGCDLGVCRLNEKEYDNTKRNILSHFVLTFSKTSRSTDSILPIHLAIEHLYFIEENSKNLRNFFEQCSDIICELTVNFPLDGGSLTSNCSDLSFPILQSLEFVFETNSDIRYFESKAPVFGSNTNGFKLLQEILQNSKNLKYFSLFNEPEAAINVSCLKLPTTIKSLDVQSSLTSNEWDLLTKNKLPYLNVLNLVICNEPEEHQIYKILERFQFQLKVVNLSFELTDENLRTAIRLPVMEKLETFHLSGPEFDLLPPLKRVWPTLVSNLSCLILRNMTESQFLEWVQDTQFESVKKLHVSLRCTDEDGFQIVMSPYEQIFKEIKSSFPNIEKLTLDINLHDTTNLKYLFKNFTHLKKLHLNFDYDDSDGWGLPGYKVVSALLGISLELATSIVNKKEKNVKIAWNNPHSIMNLTELNSLTLWTLESYYPEREDDPFCSETFSKYGLSKMRKLKKIKLVDGFKPGPRPEITVE